MNAAPPIPAPRPADEPEFGESRRKFLIAMFMLGAVKPERVVEAVVGEVEREAAEAVR
jgi:hypothetical protein